MQSKKNRKQTRNFLLGLFAVSVLLPSCSGDVKDNLGMRRNAPDEFAVEKRPRLDMPPQFKLRPPAPGELPLNVEEPRDAARLRLIDSPIVGSAQSSAEENFLSKVGVTRSDENIRSTIREEYQEEEDAGILTRIRKISDDNLNKTLVDAKKEKERIDENIKENKPITEGETPAKSMKDGKPILEKILD